MSNVMSASESSRWSLKLWMLSSQSIQPSVSDLRFSIASSWPTCMRTSSPKMMRISFPNLLVTWRDWSNLSMNVPSKCKTNKRSAVSPYRRSRKKIMTPTIPTMLVRVWTPTVMLREVLLLWSWLMMTSSKSVTWAPWSKCSSLKQLWTKIRTTSWVMSSWSKLSRLLCTKYHWWTRGKSTGMGRSNRWYKKAMRRVSHWSTKVWIRWQLYWIISS